MKRRDFVKAKRAAFVPASVVAFAAFIGLPLCGCVSPPLTQNVAEAGLSPAPSAGQASRATSADALAWWKRTLDAPRTAPVQASVVVTRFASGDALPAISRYEVLEAPGGRKYRITYHAPKSAAGRIVLCDGQTIWQYEPNHDTVLRHPVGASAPPSQTGDGDLLPLPKGAFVALETEADSVAGRAVRVLVLHTSPNGPVAERRWVDTHTGRTLRSETYDASSRKKRRVEMTNVVFSPPVTPDDFVPNLVPGVRIVDTAQGAQKGIGLQSGQTAASEARRVHLPVRAKHFTLQSVQTAQGATKTTHLIYSDGAAAVSVFVTPVSRANPVLQGADGWKPVHLDGAGQGEQVWTQETTAQTAIAWMQNHARMVAVAQMPVRDLLPLVEVFISDERQDTARPTP